jgi:hypothetical protein
MRNHMDSGITVTSLLIFILLFSSCNKYEEGPAFSLRTKEKRLQGIWKATRIVEREIEIDDEYTIAFKIAGAAENRQKLFESHLVYTWDELTVFQEAYGTWDFSNDDEHLFLEYKTVNVNYRDQWGSWPTAAGPSSSSMKTRRASVDWTTI